MRIWISAVVTVALLASMAVSQVDEQTPPDMPQPAKEHQWLQKLVGEWTTEAELMMAPDQPPTIAKGTERARAIGDFWIVAENKSEMMGAPFTGILTLGYDTRKGKYIGTWIDSFTDHMWTYEGTINEAGDTLTLNTEGPNPEEPGKTLRFRETIQIKDKNHKVFTSTFQGEDGSWSKVITVNYTRK